MKRLQLLGILLSAVLVATVLPTAALRAAITDAPEGAAGLAPLESEPLAPVVVDSAVPDGDFSNPPPSLSELGSNPPGAIPVDFCRGEREVSPSASTDEPTPGRISDPAHRKQLKRDAGKVRAPEKCAAQRAAEARRFNPATSQQLDELTTESEKVFRNADGSLTRELSLEPKRVRGVDGSWHDVDLGFVQGDKGLSPRVSAVPFVVPADPKDGIAAFDTRAGEFRMRLPELSDGLGSPSVVGRFAVSQGPEKSPTVRVSGRASGLEQDLVIYDASRSSYLVDFELPVGVTAKALSGAVEFVDADGKVVARFGGGFAFDSKFDSTRGSGAETQVNVALERADANVARVLVSIDPSWLSSPKRVFPVVIDPIVWVQSTYSDSTGFDTFIDSDYQYPVWDSPELRLGSWDPPYQAAASLLWFNVDGIKGDNVVALDTYLQLDEWWAASCTPSAIDAVGIGSFWWLGSTTWDSQPVDDGRGVRGQTYAAHRNDNAGCPEDFVTIPFNLPSPATSLGNAWVRTNDPAVSQPNYGVYLFADDYDSVFGWKKFLSGNILAGQYAPSLHITYTHQPPEPTMTAPANEATVSKLTPTLSVNPVTDPDGDPVQYWFKVSTSPSVSGGNEVANSGWQSSTSWTPPVGALQDGTVYYWNVWTFDGNAWTVPKQVSRFKVDLRLGAGGPSPMDGVGPVSVNLATGNLIVNTSSPSFPTVGGEMGLAYSYNSLEAPRRGLDAYYYPNANLDGSGYVVSRRDQNIDFDWGLGNIETGVPGVGDNQSARWTGNVTVPQTGAWTFGTRSDDGVRVWVNGQLVVDRWFDQAATGTPVWSATPLTLTANTAYSIKVEYYERTQGASLELWAKAPGTYAGGLVVPPEWLSPAIGALPQGWKVNPGGGGLAYTQLVVWYSAVVAVGPDQDYHTYTNDGTGWKPPAGENGILAQDPTGWTLTAYDGNIYRFDTAGQLQRVLDPVDDLHPAGTTFTYQQIGTGPRRLTQMADPVSGKTITLHYQGDGGTCDSTGFSTPPSYSLCKVTYGWDNTTTKLYYDSSGRFVRIEDPGGALPEVTDFAYDSAGRITKIRDPLAADAVAAPATGRANDDTTRTLIAYDGSGRVTGVQLAEPTAGAPRPQHTYEYTIGSDGSGTSVVHVTGLSEPNGFARKVEFDSLRRLTKDYDATNLATTTAWTANKDYVTSVTAAASTSDPNGLRSTTIYDYADRPTDRYGPAPAAWFGLDNKPLSAYAASTPHASTAYDEGWFSLGVAYWDNTELSGSPKAHDLGIGGPFANIQRDWGGASPYSGIPGTNWSARLTGEVTFPEQGNYNICAVSDDGVRIWIDDKIFVDSWIGQAPTLHCGSELGRWFSTAAPGEVHRVRIDYFQAIYGSTLEFKWQLPSGGPFDVNPVPGNLIRPRYGLVTSSTDPDGKKTSTVYQTPLARGLVSEAHADPDGLNLITRATYETSASEYFRRKSRILPAGNTWTYDYYADAELRDIPASCPGAVTGVNQAGSLKKTTAPSATNRVDEVVYDKAGRIAAARTGTDPWTCLQYDGRGRLTQKVIPANTTEPSRTVTYNYAVSNNPLQTSVSDSAGTITTTVDLLGRVVSYTDVWAKTSTYAYDQVGRLTDGTTPSIGANATLHSDYDVAGRSTGVKLNGNTLATPTYDAAGRLNAVAYPSGAGNAGNGTSLAPVLRDGIGRVTKLDWRDPAATLITSDEVARTLAGRVTNELIDGTDPAAGDNFVYDGAGRLTTAQVPGHTYTYGFNPNGACPGSFTDAGRNTNRTTMTDSGGPATTYCYDNADRLTSTNTPGLTPVAYDSHGNTTTLGAQTFGYDQADRHLSSSTGGVSGKKLLLVVADPNPTNLNAADAAVRTRLLNAGWIVKLADDNGITAGAANEQDLVLISSTVASANVAATFKTTAVPVVVWENAVLDDMGLTGTASSEYGTAAAQNTVAINAAAHPLAAGLTGTPTVTSSNQTLTWGKPAAGATKIATLNSDSTKATVFSYETGAQMVGLTAPARRVGFLLHDDTATASNANGWALFDAAINWARTKRAVLVVDNPASLNSGDTAVKSRLQGAGWAVTVVDDNGVTADAANGADAVVISSSSISTNINAAFKDIKVPVVAWEGGVFDDMGLTATNDFGTTASQTAVSITTASHLLAAGLSGSPTVTSSNQTLSWGRPAAAASKIATTTGDATKATVFSYETGAQMVGLTAPARRVGFLLENTTASALNANGWALFDAAINWVGDIPPPATTVRYVRDATDRIVARTVTVAGATTQAQRYSYTGAGDTPELTLDTTNTVTEQVLGLPGGATLTRRSSGDVWSYPNLHGDVTATANSAGQKQGATLSYDPYGNALGGLPDNSAGDYDNGWLGQHQRGLEHAPGLMPVIEMGARQYHPGLGRFLEVDPVEGGSCNDYEYTCADPQGAKDLTGQFVECQTPNPTACGVETSIEIVVLLLALSLTGGKDDRVAVYRVASTRSSAVSGAYWTPINPLSVKNYRSAAGLPDANTGEYLSVGTVHASDLSSGRIRIGGASPLPSRNYTRCCKGGLPQLLIRNPTRVVSIAATGRMDPRRWYSPPVRLRRGPR